MHLCRICVKEIVGPATELFSYNEESEELVNRIFLCSQVFFSLQENCPSAICQVCLQELGIANNFRLKCISSEKMLREVIKPENKQVIIKYEKEDGDPGDHLSYIYGGTFNNYGEEPKEDINMNPGNICRDESNYTQFSCDICNKMLKTELSLRSHKLKMHENRKHIGLVSGYGASRLYQCMKCSYSTPYSQSLVNHDRKHTGERPYHCVCGKSFTQSASLVAHSRTHSKETFFTCSVCGKQFKHAFSLTKHMTVHQDGSYSCDLCKKMLKTKTTLKQHLLRHYNVKEFSCEQCGASFVTKMELTNHRKKHKLEKKIECHLCGYKTHAKKVLMLHLKRHAGDKSFKCEQCDVSCYTRAELRIHSRVHTREKPYQCPACSQRFTHSSSVNKHLRNLHGINYKWCDVKTNLKTEIKD